MVNGVEFDEDILLTNKKPTLQIAREERIREEQETTEKIKGGRRASIRKEKRLKNMERKWHKK